MLQWTTTWITDTQRDVDACIGWTSAGKAVGWMSASVAVSWTGDVVLFSD